jgi:hypothetical protein
VKLEQLMVLHIIFYIVSATCVALPDLQSFQSTGSKLYCSIDCNEVFNFNIYWLFRGEFLQFLLDRYYMAGRG